MKMPDLLHTMTWSKGGSGRSPAEGDIVVETRAVGLNFRVCIVDSRPTTGNPTQKDDAVLGTRIICK